VRLHACVRWLVVLAVIATGLTLSPIARAATCSVPGTHATINDATADVTCTVIELGKGPFYENVTVPNSGVTIVGKGGECGEKPQTIIDASPGGVNATGTHVQADNVTMKNLVIRHGTAGIDVEGNNFRARDICTFGHRGEGEESSGVVLDGDNALIKNSEFHSSDGAAVKLNSGSTATVTGNHGHNLGWNCFVTKLANTTFASNRAIACDDHGFKTGGGPAGVVVRDNVIDSVDRGIEVRSTGAMILRNSITNSQSFGIQIEDSDDSLVKRNTIVSARQDCIEILGSGGTDVIGNTAKECLDGNAAIQVRDEEDYVVEDNVIGNAKERCIWAENTNDVRVVNNVSKQCGGIEAASGSNPVIRNNSISRQWEFGNAFRIDCTTDCSGAEIVGNSVGSTNRDHSGFHVTADDADGLIAENRSTNAGGHGFNIEVDNWTIRDNIAVATGQRESTDERNGFHFQDADGNTITNNVAKDGRNDGFYLNADSDGNTLTGNRATNNTKDGFHIAGDEDLNVLDGNKAIGNHAEGIENDGLDTDIKNNVAKNNRWDCNFFDGTETPAPVGNTCADGLDPNVLPPQGEVD
jgi:parallel beta-helix repeat protein